MGGAVSMGGGALGGRFEESKKKKNQLKQK